MKLSDKSRWVDKPLEFTEYHKIFDELEESVFPNQHSGDYLTSINHFVFWSGKRRISDKGTCPPLTTCRLSVQWNHNKWLTSFNYINDTINLGQEVTISLNDGLQFHDTFQGPANHYVLFNSLSRGIEAIRTKYFSAGLSFNFAQFRVAYQDPLLFPSGEPDGVFSIESL